MACVSVFVIVDKVHMFVISICLFRLNQITHLFGYILSLCSGMVLVTIEKTHLSSANLNNIGPREDVGITPTAY